MNYHISPLTRDRTILQHYKRHLIPTVSLSLCLYFSLWVELPCRSVSFQRLRNFSSHSCGGDQCNINQHERRPLRLTCAVGLLWIRQFSWVISDYGLIWLLIRLSPPFHFTFRNSSVCREVFIAELSSIVNLCWNLSIGPLKLTVPNTWNTLLGTLSPERKMLFREFVFLLFLLSISKSWIKLALHCIYLAINSSELISWKQEEEEE